MYGDLAEKLVQDARRTMNLEELPAYPGNLVLNINREQRILFEKMSGFEDALGATQEIDRKEAAGLFVMRLATQRNKRCLLGHQYLRSSRVDQAIWDENPVNQEQLSAAEQVYLREYSDLVTDYKSEWTDIDLTGTLEPPQQMYVEIRVLREAGEIQTEYGVFNFNKGSHFFLRTADVQRLVQQGFVEVVEGG